MPGKFSRSGGITALASVPLDTFLALCTSRPTPDALGSEYAAVGYARRPMRRTHPPTATDPPTISNADPVTFGPFTEGTGDAVGWVMMMQAATGGTAVNMCALFELDEPRTPGPGDALVLDAGALVLNCS